MKLLVKFFILYLDKYKHNLTAKGQAKANSGFGHYEAKQNDVFRFASWYEAKRFFLFLTEEFFVYEFFGLKLFLPMYSSLNYV